MIPVFLISNRPHTGKNFFALGLGLNLKEKGYKVGYMKLIGKVPFKKGDEIIDEEAMFISQLLELNEPMEVISPFVLTYETQYHLLEKEEVKVKEKLLKAIKSHEDKDILLIIGGDNYFEGFSFNLKPFEFIKEVNGKALVVQLWDDLIAIDDILGAKELLQENFLGAVLNKVLPEQYLYLKEKVVPFLAEKGVEVYGVIKKDKMLEAVTVRVLLETVNGGIVCCEDKLDDLVENFLVGAMDPEHALSYFLKTPNKAVITGVHRTDIQIVAMETSTKCLILTGGLHANETVVGIAKSKGIPIIVTSMDTFSTVDRIEKLMGRAIIREKEKALKSKEILANEFNFEAFLSKLEL